jgi:hypothetical protein
MVLLSLIPQIHLWIVRGREWNGAYVVTQGDEPLYSAYINALTDGRPRKNDPFGGQDSTLQAPLPESTFSIQFVPAYVISLLARTFAVSASTAFIVLAGAVALLATVSIFWLLNCVSGDYRLASAGTLFVLCLGGAVGTFGLFGTLIDSEIPALPFLRRYEPAAAFPFFFFFQVLVWYALTSPNKRTTLISAIFAGLTMAMLVFSYVYLWTSAAASLVCVAALWLYFRPSDRWKTLSVLITIGLITATAILPYANLVSHRAAMLDEKHTLIATHRVDLFRLPEIIGAVILVALVIGVFRTTIDRTDSRVLYVASVALLPFLVFNQQVLTGKTMQAFHFEVFVINYSILVGLLISVALLWKSISTRVVIWTAALSISWGVFAVALPSRLVFVPAASALDQIIPVLKRLNELSIQDGKLAALRKTDQATLVFSPELAVTVLLPTWAAQGTLLDIGGIECGTITHEQRKEFFYMHLYYSNVKPEVLREALSGSPIFPSMERYAPIVVFGSERVSPVLSFNFTPIRRDEIEREVHVYETYVNSFSRTDVLKRPIAYAVIPVEGNFDFTNIDRWYERNAGERVGDYVLYRLKLRPE